MMSMIDCIARGEVAKLSLAVSSTQRLCLILYTQMRYKLVTPSIQILQVQPNTVVLRLEVKNRHRLLLLSKKNVEIKSLKNLVDKKHNNYGTVKLETDTDEEQPCSAKSRH